MSALPMYSSDVAFTAAVKAIQAERGSRAGYHRMEQKGSWPDRMTPDLERFVAAQRSVFLATASADGQPYIQHRGGPPGFLKVLDDKTIGFADYAGNRQYVTIGNLSENPRCQLFLIDYARRQRVKIWGEARVVEDANLTAKLMPQGYKARPEGAIIFTVTAWDVNCSQHIPQLFEAAALVECAKHVAALEEEVARLRAQLPHSSTS
jgi:uncharacterized protein